MIYNSDLWGKLFNMKVAGNDSVSSQALLSLWKQGEGIVDVASWWAHTCTWSKILHVRSLLQFGMWNWKWEVPSFPMLSNKWRQPSCENLASLYFQIQWYALGVPSGGMEEAHMAHDLLIPIVSHKNCLPAVMVGFLPHSKLKPDTFSMIHGLLPQTLIKTSYSVMIWA